MRGRFIVLEGPDGSGTTSHAAQLAARMQILGEKAFITHEPTNGAIGKFIRKEIAKETISADALQLLFTADRAAHIAEELMPALSAGYTVISDRYWLSTVVYAKALGIRTEGLEYINKGFLQPDVQIVLLPPLKVCLERLGERSKRDILETDSLQRRVYKGYKDYAKKLKLPVIDTSGDKQSVADAVAEAAGL